MEVKKEGVDFSVGGKIILLVFGIRLVFVCVVRCVFWCCCVGECFRR